MESKLNLKVGLPLSREYISSLSGSRIIGWTGKVDGEIQPRASQMIIEDLDFEICTGLFKDEYITNRTHMCGHAVYSDQHAEIVII